MEQIRINRAAISKVIWGNILSSVAHVDREFLSDPLDFLNSKRANAAYNTGSINFTNAWCLYALTRYLKPAFVAEVGTFIGRSTMAMAEGMQAAMVDNPVIHTCDSSNDINLKDVIDIDLVQYPKTSSTDMLRSLVNDSKKVDMFFFDGRISELDLAYIEQLRHESTVFAFDDFEGVEKGAINVLNLSHLLNSGYTLMYPPDTQLLWEHGLFEPSNLAVMFPFKSLAFVPQ
jgi:hypothetical protein